MKLLFTRSFLLLLLANALHAESAASVENDTVSNWNQQLRAQLSFNQLSLTNWASGGESSIAAKSMLNYKADYSLNGLSFTFENKFAYGLVGYAGKRIEKTDDRLDLSISLSHKASDHWSYTSMLTFKSQFANGYKYPDDSTLISAFMAPGYLNASLGLKYKPRSNLDVFISPASGKLTFVNNQELADKGAFGVTKAVVDSSGAVLQPGKNLLGEFGINLLANYSLDIGESVELTTTLILYNNYLDDNKSNRWNIDVDWETTINFSINKYLETVLFMHLKYDHDVKFPKYAELNGEQVRVGESPMLQFKESFGIAVTYRI